MFADTKWLVSCLYEIIDSLSGNKIQYLKEHLINNEMLSPYENYGLITAGVLLDIDKNFIFLL